MPNDDPTEELERIISGYQNGLMPEAAHSWASGALVTTEEILETIEGMEGNGHDRSPDQEDALENIYIAACNWLKAAP
jgi:hypothetical protein